MQVHRLPPHPYLQLSFRPASSHISRTLDRSVPVPIIFDIDTVSVLVLETNLKSVRREPKFFCERLSKVYQVVLGGNDNGSQIIHRAYLFNQKKSAKDKKYSLLCVIYTHLYPYRLQLDFDFLRAHSHAGTRMTSRSRRSSYRETMILAWFKTRLSSVIRLVRFLRRMIVRMSAFLFQCTIIITIVKIRQGDVWNQSFSIRTRE